jgi:tRNA threonylcarbamoyladenosine dehydratase
MQTLSSPLSLPPVETPREPQDAASRFDYSIAVSRNLGWVTSSEQKILRGARIAIAGLGGVGGAHLLTLARLGIGAFNIADFDDFDVQNLNRQAGAFMSTVGHSKCQTVARMAKDINPELDIRTFQEGVTEANVEAFLKDVDVYVDGLDFFVLPIRRMVFAKCRELGIPALTAAPLGMGVSFLYFDPDKTSFEDYFKLEGRSREDQYARFIAGLSPLMLNRGYLAVPESVNFAEKRGPSTAMACDFCAGMVGTTVLKLLLNRGPIKAAPWSLHFDAYLHKYHQVWRPFGNANPLQQLLIRLIRPALEGRG